MTPFEHLSLAFIAGWVGCCVFIFIAEWLQPLPDPMAEAHGDVPSWAADVERRSHFASVTDKGQQDHG